MGASRYVNFDLFRRYPQTSKFIQVHKNLHKSRLLGTVAPPHNLQPWLERVSTSECNRARVNLWYEVRFMGRM